MHVEQPKKILILLHRGPNVDGFGYIIWRFEGYGVLVNWLTLPFCHVLICSVFQFPWCKHCFQHSQFKAINGLATGLKKIPKYVKIDSHELVWLKACIPLDEGIIACDIMSKVHICEVSLKGQEIILNGCIRSSMSSEDDDKIQEINWSRVCLCGSQKIWKIL